MADYGSPRRQYASPQRQLSRDGRMRPARDLDTRTPRYSPPSSPPPPSTPSPTKRGSPSPEAPRYSRSTPKTRPSPVTYGSPGGVSTYTQRTGGSTAAWERALHRRVAALEHQLKAEVQANDELRRQAAGDTVDDGSIDTQTSLVAAKAAWRRERRVLERQLHAARAAAADAVARRPITSVEDDESVDVTDVAALVGRAAAALDGASSLPRGDFQLRRKLQAWALRSAFSVASRVPYRAVARRFAFWRGCAQAPLFAGDRTLRVVARCLRRALVAWLHNATVKAFGDWVAATHALRAADRVTSMLGRHFTRRGFRRWLRSAEALDNGRHHAALATASAVSGQRQSHEIAVYEKELREARARHARELQECETRQAHAVEEAAAQFRARNAESLGGAEDRYQRLIDEAWQATARARAQNIESIGAITRHFASAALGRCVAQRPGRARLVFFRRWVYNTRCERQRDVATSRLRATIRRWGAHCTTEAWRTWLDVVEYEARRTDREGTSAKRLRATIGRWAARRTARAWRAWTDAVASEALQANREAASARKLRAAVQRWSLRKVSQAWRAWTAAVALMARGDRRLALAARDLRLCVRRWVGRRRAAAFRTWKRFGDVQRRLERCLRRFLQRHLAMALGTWTGHSSFMNRTRECHEAGLRTLERCVGRLTHRRRAAAFDTYPAASSGTPSSRRNLHSRRWLAAAETLSAEDAMRERSAFSLERGLAQWLRRLTARAFRKWLDESQRVLNRKRAMLRAARRCVLLWVHGTASVAFRAWSGRASRLALCEDAAARLERVATRAVRRMCSTAQARAFAAFYERTAQQRSIEHRRTSQTVALEKCIRRWRRRGLGRGFETWSAVATFFHNLKRCACRMLRRRLSTAFATWSGARFRLARRQSLLRDAARTLKRSLALWFRRKGGRAFRAWRGRSAALRLRADAVKRLDRIKRRALQRLRRRSLLKGLNTWRRVLTIHHFVEDHAIKAAGALRRVLKRWLHREKARGLETWAQTVTFMRGMTRVVAKLSARLLAKAWTTWTGDVRVGLHRKALHLRGALDCERCLVLWVKRKRAQAFRQWSGRVLVLRNGSDAVRRLTRVKRRVLNRMRSQDMAKTFWTWYDVICNSRALDLKTDERAALLGRVVGRWPRRALSKAWRSWALWVRLVRDAERCLAKWRHRRRARALRAWTAYIDESCQRRDALRGWSRVLGVCVAAWLRRRAYGAFRTWSRKGVQLRALSDAAQRVHRIQGTALRRMRSVQAARAFRAWSRHAIERRGVDAAHATHCHMLLRVVKQWVRRSQSVGFRTWTRRVVLLRLLAKSVARLVRREASRVLRMWTDLIKRDKRSIQALRRVLRMWTKRRFTRSFRTWAGRLFVFKDRRTCVKRLLRIKGRALHYLRGRHCARALRSWRAYASSGRALDRKLHRTVATLKKVLRRWLNETKAVGFKCWLRNSILRRDLGRCVLRMMRRQLGRAFSTWAQDAYRLGLNADGARRLHRLKRKVMTRFIAQQVSMAFDTWILLLEYGRDGDARRAKAAQTARRCVVKWLRREISNAFGAWADAAILRNDLERCVCRMLRRRLSCAFATWSKESFHLTRCRSVLEGAARTVRRTLQLWFARKKIGAFRKWTGRAAFLTGRARALGRCGSLRRTTVHRWRVQARAQAFRAWREHAWRRLINLHEDSKAKRTARRVVRRWLARHTAHAFETWRCTTIFLRGLRRCVARLLSRRLSVAFATWTADTFRRRACETRFHRGGQQLRRCLRRWTRRKLAANVRAWTQHVTTCRARDQVRRDRLKATATCVWAWRRRGRARAFRTWVASTLFLRNVRRCICRMGHRQVGAAFVKWSGRSLTSSKRHRLLEGASRRLARSLQRWMRGKQHIMFRRWRRIVADTSQKRTVLLKAARALTRWLSLQTAVAFRAWHATSLMEAQSKQFETVWDSNVDWTHQMTLLRFGRCLRREAHKKQARAFNLWARASMGDYHGDLLKWSGAALCRRALERRHRSMRHAKLLLWRRATFLIRNEEKHRAVLADAHARRDHAAAERKAHAAAQLARWLRAKRGACLRRGFDAIEGIRVERLAAHATLARSRATSLQRCARRWSRTCQALAFRAWVGRRAQLSLRDAQSLAKQNACRRFQRTVARFEAYEASTAFRRWARATRNDAKMEAVLAKCLKRLAHRAVGRACASWWKGVFEVRRREELLSRATALLWRGGATGALVRWRRSVNLLTRSLDSLTKQETAQRAALRLVARGLEGRLHRRAAASLRHALNAWWSTNARRAFVAQRLRTIATRINAASLRVAFGAWRGHSQARRTLERGQIHAAQSMGRCVGRWTKRLQAQAFEVLARRVATSRFLVRILARLLRVKRASAFELWRNAVAVFKRNQHAHQTNTLRLNRIAERMARCLRSWSTRRQLRAFRAWADRIVQARHKLNAAKHLGLVVQRWRIQRVARAVRAWRYNTGLALQSEHFEVLWRGSLDRGQDTAALQLHRCLRRWFAKKRIVAFRAWVQAVGDAVCRENAAALCLRVVAKSTTRTLYHRLKLWQRAAFLARNAATHRLVLADAELRRRHAISERKAHACLRLARALRSTLGARVRRAWTAWAALVQHGRARLREDAFLAHERRRGLQRCVAALRAGTQVQAFRAWSANAARAASRAIILRRCARRWSARAQALAFRVWRVQARRAYRRRLAGQKSLLVRARTLARCAGVLRGGRFSLAFRTWARRTRRHADVAHACKGLVRAATRYERQLQVRSLRQWGRRSGADARAARILRTCLNRFAHRAVGRAAARWWGDLAVARRREELLARAAALLWRGSAVNAVLRWRRASRAIGRVSEQRRRALLLLRRGVKDRRGRAVQSRRRRTFAAWRRRANLLHGIATKFGSIAKTLARSAARRALRDWAAYAQRAQLVELSEHGVAAVRSEEARAQALRSTHQVKAARHVANALLRPALARGFRVFRARLTQMRRLARVCQRAHLHARCRVQRAFFALAAQRTKGDARSIINASSLWVREAGARALKVWLRRQARKFVRAAWRCWLLHVGDQRRVAQRRLTSSLDIVHGASRLERTLRRWRRAALATCMSTWLAALSIQRQRHRHDINAAATFVFRSLHRKWVRHAQRRLATWRRFVFRTRNADTHKQVLADMAARRGFAVTQRKAHAASRLANWLRRWEDRKCARYWVSWCHYILDHKEWRSFRRARALCLYRCVGRVACRATAASFRAWSLYRDDFNADVRRYEAQANRITRLFATYKSRTARRALHVWASKARRDAKVETILTRCLTNASRRALGGACASWFWHLHAARLTEARAAKLARCARRLRQPQQFRAFAAWRRGLVLTTQRIHAAARLARLERSIGKRLGYQRLGDALDAWRATSHVVVKVERIRRRAVKALRRVLSRTAYRDRRQAFKTWTAATQTMRTQGRAATSLLRVLDRALGRGTARSKGWGMRHWRAYVVAARAAEHSCGRRLVELRKCVVRVGRRSLAFAFLRWAATVKAQYRLRRLLASRILHKRKAAFRRWAAGVVERRDINEAIRRLWHVHHRRFVSWRLRRQSYGFVAWRSGVQSQRDIVQKARTLDSARNRALARVARQLMSYKRALAFRSWLRKAALARRRAERYQRRRDSGHAVQTHASQQLRRVLVQLSRSTAKLSFVRWALRVDAHARASLLLTKCARRLAHFALGKACNAWWNLIVEDRDRRLTLDQLGRCVARCLQRRLWAGFRTWFQGMHVMQRRSTETKRLYAIQKKALRRFQATSKNKAFTRWRVLVQREHTVASMALVLAVGLKTPVERWARRKVCRAFSSWSSFVLVLRNVEKVIKRCGRRYLSATFNTWSGHGFRLARQRDAAKRALRVRRRCLNRLCLSQSARALRAWVAYVADCHQLERKHGSLARVLRKGVKRWVGHCLNVAWRTWVAGVAFIRQLERLVMWFVKRHAAVAFQTWSGRFLIIDKQLNAARRLARSRRRILRHFYSVAVWMAVQTWKQQMLAGRHDARHATHACHTLGRCLRRWLQGKVGRAFGQWAALALFLHNLQRCAARLARRLRAMAFGTWTGARFHLTRRADVLERAFATQRRWLRRLLHVATQKAWRSWAAYVHSCRVVERKVAVVTVILRKSVKRWIHGILGRAYGTWVSNVLFMRQVRRVVARFEHRVTAKAFDTWTGALFSLNRRADAVKRVLRTKKRMARHLTSRRASRAFLTWHAHMLHGRTLNSEQQLSAYKLRRALQKWLHCFKLKAFETWCASVLRKRNLERVLLRMTKRRLALGWRTWTLQNLSLVTRRDALVRAIRIKDRALRRMQMRLQYRALRTWQPHALWDRAVAVDRVMGMRILRRCLSRWAKRDAASAWRTWVTKARRTHCIRRCCAHLVKRHLALCFQGWSAHSTRLSRKERAVRRLVRLETQVLQRWSRRGLAKGVRTWRIYVIECAALERKFATILRALRAGLQRWSAGRIKVLFKRWHTTICFFNDFRRCLLRMVRRRLALGYQTWSLNAGLATKRARAMRSVLRSKKRSIKHLQHRRLARALRVLCVNGSQTIHRKGDRGTAVSLLRRYARRWERGQKHVTFRVWSRHALTRTRRGAAALRALGVGRRALKRWRLQLLGRSVATWRARTTNDHAAMGILTRVALRWKSGTVSRAFRRWAVAVTRYTARKKAVVQLAKALMRCGARHRRNGLGAGLFVWRAQVSLDNDIDADKRQALDVLARGAATSRRFILAHGVKVWRAYAVDVTRARTRIQTMHLLANRCGRRVKRRAINQWRLKRDQPAKQALKRHIIARFSAVSRQQLLKAFVVWNKSAPRASEDFWHANAYLRRAITSVETRNDPALKAALRSCALRAARTQHGWLRLHACCFDEDGVYLGPSLAINKDEVLLDGGSAQITSEGFCVDRVGRASLEYVLSDGEAWVAAIDASLAHHALVLRRLHSDTSCKRPSIRRAAIKGFRERPPAFPPKPFEELRMVPAPSPISSPREVAAGVVEVMNTDSSSQRTGLESLVVKAGFLLYERLPNVWRRRFLKLRAVSFDVTRSYAGPSITSSTDEDAPPLATFPLETMQIRSSPAEAGLYPLLFVDKTSDAAERFAASTRHERDGWLHAVQAAREQHAVVIDSLNGVPPPPPPETDDEPERTHLFRFGVNATKGFQCIHCAFRGDFEEVAAHERVCAVSFAGVLSCSARGWRQARYALEAGVLVGDGQRFVLKDAVVRAAEPCGFDVGLPGRGPVCFGCATAAERDAWTRALGDLA